MAKLKVVHNMFDTVCNTTRYEGDVFVVEDKKRVDELLKSKAVVKVEEKPNGN